MALLPDLDHLKVFYFAAKYNSITKAAQELFLSQPAATRTIHLLEAQLDCQLLVRSSRGVTLTPEGNILYQALGPAMEDIERALTSLARMRRLENGYVHVGVNNLAAEYILKQSLELFGQRYPGITVTVSRITPGQMASSLQNGWIDFALYIDMGDYPELAGAPVITADNETVLTSQLLGDFPDVLLAGPKYAALAKGEITLAQLREIPLIVPTPVHAAAQYYLMLLRGVNLPGKDDITVDGAEARLALTRQGMGITHFPAAFVQDQLDRRELYQLRTDLPMRNNTIYLYSVSPTLPNAAAQRFVDMLFELNGRA